MSEEVSKPVKWVADFKILAETEDWIAVDKPAPLLVHPTRDDDEPTLWHGLRELLLYELTTGGSLSLINRLDRETSGISLAAKNPVAARELGLAMQNRRFKKTYQAIVFGHPAWDRKTMDYPIRYRREFEESRVRLMQAVHPEGKPCFTEAVVLERFEQGGRPFSLVECQPLTGRMHQIRVHLSAEGFPLVGDKIYGPTDECYLRQIAEGWSQDLLDILLLPRHALHASRLSFPFHGEWVDITSPLPADMQAFRNEAVS